MRCNNRTPNTGIVPTRMPTAPDVNAVMGLREWGLILVLSVIWGGSFFFVGVAVVDTRRLRADA